MQPTNFKKLKKISLTRLLRVFLYDKLWFEKKSKVCRNLFRNERKVAFFMIGFYVGSIPTHRTMNKIIKL